MYLTWSFGFCILISWVSRHCNKGSLFFFSLTQFRQKKKKLKKLNDFGGFQLPEA
jgi:hypothetical protein